MTALSEDEVGDLARKIAELEERLRSAVAERDAAVERQTAATLEQFRLETALHAALDRQKASAEILRSIGATSGDAAYALRQIAETTAHFFNAPSVTIRIAEGDQWVQNIRVGSGSLASGAHPGSPLIERGASLPATVYQENRQIHIGDLDTIDPSMAHWPAVATRAVGIRTISGTPLRREGKAIGALIIYRDRLAPFTDEELALQQSFADQAVIAIENARLFNETTEALERQTATADILKVIASSPSDAQPVFDAIAANANRLVGGFSTAVHRVIDDIVDLAALTSVDPEADGTLKSFFPRHRSEVPALASVENGETAQIADIETGDELTGRIAYARGWRSVTFTPLMNQGACIGFIACTRRETGALADHYVQLLRTFADQAVIAIENARLFNETEEALARQTATADILRVISGSPTDVKPVFDAIVQTAVRLLGCETAFILRCDGVHFWAVARCRREGLVPVFVPQRTVIDPSANFPSRVIVDKTTLHLPDWSEVELPEFERRIQQQLGYQSAVYLPLLREGECIGVLGIAGSRPRMFGETAIALAESFRDQAVIAIENTRLFNETQEALARQTATADILRVISASPTDVQPVFDAIVQTAVRLLGCDRAFFMRVDGHTYTPVAGVSRDGPFTLGAPDQPIDPAANFPSRAIAAKQMLHIPDWTHVHLPEHEQRIREMFGVNSSLYLPLLRGDDCIGLLVLVGSQPNMFGTTAIALAESFRDQAVIAIENTRLFNETQEALERQTATAEVLQVINSSPGNLAPVFDAILEKAHKLCGVAQGSLQLYDGSKFRAVAVRGLSEAFANRLREGISLNPNAPGPHLLKGARFVQIPDLGEIDDPMSRAAFELAGIRTVLFIPLRKDGTLLGRISASRPEVKLFTETEIGLLENFAAQAVIAIENARLFNETQEALERQTATADILKVIASSPSDVKPVFEAIAARAKSLVGGFSSTVFRFIDGVAHLEAFTPTTPEADEVLKSTFPRPVEDFAPFRMTQAGEVMQIPDTESLTDDILQISRARGFRSMVFAPLMNQGASIGFIAVTRVQPGAFSDHHVQVLRTFADQGVIAIENARLFDEVQAKTHDLEESLQQQTATSEVLQIISSSPSDLAPVFEKMLENATRVCGAGFGSMILLEGDMMRQAAFYNAPAELAAVRTNAVRPLHPLSSIAAAARDKRVIQTDDIRNSPAYLARAQHAIELAELGGARTIVVVPMLRDDQAIGVITVYRREVRPFGDKQIELVSNFAKQAVIAIENARLLRELRQRTADLSKSLDDLRTAQDRLIQTEKLASLGQLTAGIAHEIKNPLNFVNNFSALSIELTDELDELLKQAALADKLRGEIGELTGLLKDNLSKVVQHGKRADSIVKNMLLHSREGSGEHRPADVNALVDESLNLAYHGARAEKPGFNVTLQRDFDPDAGLAEVFPQEITRVLLNLISNGFYAVTKRKTENGGDGFEPRVTASTHGLADRVEIRIRDNGTGIPPEVKEKMFNPFFTTKAAGEGTGLGLSMSHDIIVKQHGGTIEVETEQGAFTEFRVMLPRSSAVSRDDGG